MKKPGKKNGKTANKAKRNKNSDNVLQSFSSFNGIVVDYQKLFHYQPPVLPIYDVRLIDRFDPNSVKYEYVMVKIGEEFHSVDYCVKRFTNFSLKLANILQNTKCLWELSADYVQKQIMQSYDRLPTIDLPSALHMKDPCMLDFMTLTVAIKYAGIIKTYKNPIREQILQRREPILQDFIRENNLDGTRTGLQFYEWFLSLMHKYADNNEKIYFRQIYSNNMESNVPYILPFVGTGAATDFYTPEAIRTACQHSHFDFMNESDSENDREQDGQEDENFATVENAEEFDIDYAEQVVPCVPEETNRESLRGILERNSGLLTLLPKFEFDILRESPENIVIYSGNPDLEEKINREYAITDDALIGFFQNNFEIMTADQRDFAMALRSASALSIREMSNYLGNARLNFSADQFQNRKWELLRQYVRVCYRVLIGEGECRELNQATDKRQLNELRLSFLAQYEIRRLKEIQQSIERKEAQSQIVKLQKMVDALPVNEKSNKSSHERHDESARIQQKETEQENHEPVVKQKKKKVTLSGLSAEERRMRKLYKKCCRPGRSTDVPTWDTDDSEDDDSEDS